METDPDMCSKHTWKEPRCVQTRNIESWRNSTKQADQLPNYPVLLSACSRAEQLQAPTRGTSYNATTPPGLYLGFASIVSFLGVRCRTSPRGIYCGSPMPRSCSSRRCILVRCSGRITPSESLSVPMEVVRLTRVGHSILLTAYVSVLRRPRMMRTTRLLGIVDRSRHCSRGSRPWRPTYVVSRACKAVHTDPS
jgi:hypothetical protein